MLGEQVGEERGQMSGLRVMRSRGKGQVIEVSFNTSGKLLGVEHNDLGTYQSVMRPGGTYYGEGQGMVMAKNGESATWVGNGVGRPKRDGGFSWRGAIYYQSESPTLKKLNGVAVLFEHEVDANNNVTNKFWEWK